MNKDEYLKGLRGNLKDQLDVINSEYNVNVDKLKEIEGKLLKLQEELDVIDVKIFELMTLNAISIEG